MFTNVKILIRLFATAIFNAGENGTSLTPYRIFCLLVMVPSILLIIFINRIFLALDHILFPGFRKVNIKSPVFIIGGPRSGTTLIYRAMSLDKQFTSFVLWELLFAPSVTQRKIFTLVGRLDARLLFGTLHTILKAIDWLVFKKTYDIHRVSLFENEDDDLLLLNTFGTVFIAFMFPYFHQVRKFLYFDHLMPEKEKRLIMSRYKSCIKRHLYFHGPDKTFLSKSPMFSSKIRSIQEMCPDARVINPIRTPLELIPSDFGMQDLFYGMLGMKLEKIRDHKKELLEVLYNWYMHLLEERQNFMPDKFCTSRYEELTSNLEGQMHHFYATLNIPMAPDFARKLEKESLRSGGYVSRHSYSLEKFGLDEDTVIEMFMPVFAALDFDAPRQKGARAA